MRQRDGIIIWPAYLDSTLTRGQGRRIPKNLGAPDVSLATLKKAADAIKLESEVVQDKYYPRGGRTQKGVGYLVITDTQGHKKNRLLLMLAKRVRVISAKTAEAKKAVEKKKGKKKKKKGKPR
jgi:signal recognition particle subunit SRP19